MAKTKNNDFEKMLMLHACEEKSKFLDLLFNSQKIQGLAEDEPVLYVQKTMLAYGYMLAYKISDKWYLVKYGGNNGQLLPFGDYEKYSIIFENGKTINDLVLNKDVFIIRYTPTKHGLDLWLDYMCKKIARIDVAIENNLLQASLGSIIGCDNVNVTSVKEALRQASQGDFAVFTSNNVADRLNADKIQAQFIGDKLYELKRKYVKEVLTRLIGVASAEEKKERTTSYDLNVNEATDTAYIYVDTFNNDCKTYKIPFKMSINSTIEELYNKYFEIDNNSNEGGETNE